MCNLLDAFLGKVVGDAILKLDVKRLSKGQIDGELRVAHEAFARGDPPAAIQKLELLLRSNPDCGEAHFGRGLILSSQERFAEALAAFTEALRYDPDNPKALWSAAQTSLKLRLPEQTERFARRLVRVQPTNDRAFFLLSIALGLSGRWDEALEAVERSLAIKPLELDYVVGKAQLFAKLRLQSLAIGWYRKALEIHAVPQIAKELAELLIEESQVHEALTLLKRFWPQLPPEARPHVLIARAYTESQRYEEAEPHWIEAGKFATSSRGLVEMRARSEIWGGRLGVAEELLREALKDDPTKTLYYSLLAPIVTSTDADMPLIENMEQLLAKGDLDASAKQDLNYALGKSYNDLGHYETAMQFYDEANRLRSELPQNHGKFDRAFWRANVDFQIQFFSKERVRSFAKEGLESKKPLFILGMIRSGTTLSEQILSGHTKIEAGGENSFWVDHRGEVLDPRIGKFDMASGRRLGREYLQILDSLGPSAEYVTDKNPSNMMFGAPLHCLYPNARFIHTKRHAVANLLSIWMTPIKAGLQFISSREDLVFAYREYLRLWSHLEDLIPEDRFRTFQYEEITSNPVSTIESMLGFLELDSEPACFQPQNNPRMVRTPSAYQVRQPINTDSQARWRRYEPWLGPFADLLEVGAD